MLMLISPAKKLDYQSSNTTSSHTRPQFVKQVQELVKIMRGYSPEELAGLMKLSDKLAGLNAARFAQWQDDFTLENSRPALLAFMGDVYAGMDAASFSQEQLEFAQRHLRILSGLYGILRPLDLMQPYRLEMGTKLANNYGTNLYQFWGDSLTQHINDYMQQQQLSTLLNLASNEYFKAIQPSKLAANLVNVDFRDKKDGQYKIISFYAKKARGMMVRYVVENKVSSVSQLQHFDSAGYYFSAELSSPTHLVFLRDKA